MLQSLYERDGVETLHRGAIYPFRPIPWLEPPLWLLRDIQWSESRYGNTRGYAHLVAEQHASDAFRLGSQQQQESVMAQAKKRFVIVLSSDVESRRSQVRQVLVAPAYTLHETHHPSFRDALREGRAPFAFYLPADPQYPEVGECFLDFRQVQPCHKGFLDEDKLPICLASEAVKAVLYKYAAYLRA